MEFLVSQEHLVHLDLPDSKVQLDPLDHRDPVYFHLAHLGPNRLDLDLSHLDDNRMVGIRVFLLARFETFYQNLISSNRLTATSVRSKQGKNENEKYPK